MHWLDLVILGMLGLGAWRGFSTGAVRQLAGILGLVLAFALGVQLMDEVGRMVTRSLAVSETAAPVLGFVLVFLGVWFLVSLVEHLVESIFSVFRLSGVDRLAGGALGAFQAALLLSLAFLLLRPMELPGTEARREAELYPPVASVLPATWAYARTYWPRLKDLSEQFGRQVEAELF